MKLPLPWMREFARIDAGPADVGARFGSCGFEVASIDGDVLDLEITANRPDCLSVYGLSREAATAFDVDLAAAPDGPARDGSASIKVSIGDAGCGRYALAIAKVKIGPSPDWLAERLTAAGVRPINNVVDVTNYVMLETGHPMHAFDVAKLAGPEIRVRRARAGERLTTLDGVDRPLDESMVVIADRERPVAIGGVMGGAASEVSGQTTHVALESAWFLPASIRATAKRVGLKTEASARFERGADLTAPVRALRRALALLEKIEAGQGTGGVSDVYPRAWEAKRVKLSRARIERLLGDRVPDADAQRILTRLGFTVNAAPDGWVVDVPAFRVDVSREADLIEEVGRHWGFDRIPARFPAVRVPPRALSPAIARDRTIRRVLTGAGLQEACTFTFMERDAALPFAPSSDGPDGLVAIANPLSEKFSVLRPSLLPGLLDALIYSRRRETDDVRLFETGGRFRPDGEGAAVGWVIAGPRGEHWSGKTGDVDVFDAIGTGQIVGDALGIALDARASADHPWFVRGRAADLVATHKGETVVVGSAGELRPDLVSSRGLAQRIPVVGGELDVRLLADLASSGRTAGIEALPRFPSIVRDLSIVVSERLPAADLRGTIRSSASASLVLIEEFDRYQGKGVPDGMISLSIRLTFRDRERTLTDAEVQRAVDGIVAALAARHGATLRQ